MFTLKSAFAVALIFSTSFVSGADTPAPSDTPDEHQGSRRVVTEMVDDTILLHAKDASVHGSTVRYEPAPQKNTIGYWFKPEDWASWEFDVTKPGTYEVEVLQGCGKGSGGSEVEVSAGGKALTFTVEDTGGFQNFVPRKLGTVTLAAGRQTLSVKPKTKPGLAVMDLRQVTLHFVESK